LEEDGSSGESSTSTSSPETPASSDGPTTTTEPVPPTDTTIGRDQPTTSIKSIQPSTSTSESHDVQINGATVSGVLEVEMNVIGSVTPKALENLFKKGIAAAIGVPMELVVNVTVTEIPSGALNITRPAASGQQRRLRSSQTKRYEVHYEVVVPKAMDVDAIIEKANSIAVSGSPESAFFREELTKDSSVVAVGNIAILEQATIKTKVGDQGEKASYQAAVPSDSTGLRMGYVSAAVMLLWFTRSF
jgi:hypothetical protein